jgi:hypothetical protein
MTQDTYNWNAISKGAISASVGVVLAFANLASNWKWIITLLCMAGAYAIVSFSSKKKQDLFSAIAIVFAVAVAMHALSTAGML